MADVLNFMDVRPVTDDDIAFWKAQGEEAVKVFMRGDHIGARNIEVLWCRRADPFFSGCWRVPYVAVGDNKTYWFTMFCETFPPIAAVVQPGIDE